MFFAHQKFKLRAYNIFFISTNSSQVRNIHEYEYILDKPRSNTFSAQSALVTCSFAILNENYSAILAHYLMKSLMGNTSKLNDILLKVSVFSIFSDGIIKHIKRLFNAKYIYHSLFSSSK